MSETLIISADEKKKSKKQQTKKEKSKTIDVKDVSTIPAINEAANIKTTQEVPSQVNVSETLPQTGSGFRFLFEILGVLLSFLGLVCLVGRVNFHQQR